MTATAIYTVRQSRIIVEPGTRYSYKGQEYAVVCVARDGRTKQEKIVYVGTNGPDEGRNFVCTLSDFALRFTLVPIPEPEPEGDSQA